MNFMNKVALADGSTMKGSALMTASDVYTQTQADARYSLSSDISINHYTKANLQTSGQASVHWNNITSKPSYDNYGGWLVKANGEASGMTITSGSALDIRGSGATSVTRSGSVITISSANENNFLSGVTGVGNGTVTFTRNGMANLSLNLAHGHAISEISGLRAELDSKATTAGATADIASHKTEAAPHTYGGKFQFAFNPTFGALELQVIA